MPTEFTEKVIKIIQEIPRGKVLTYGIIAKLAGNPRAARQVSWLLHSSSKKYNLPWHRVINSKGLISLKEGRGKERQRKLLESENIKFYHEDKIDLKEYLWDISSIKEIDP